MGHDVGEAPADLLLALGEEPSPAPLGLPSALWALSDPYAFRPERSARWLFSNDANAANRYPRQAIHLPLAFDDLAPPPLLDGPRWDFVFVGQPFPRRVIVLQGIQAFLAKHRTIVVGPGWGGKLDPAIHLEDAWMSWEEVRNLWSSSRVVLQLHRDAFFENPRRIPPASPSARVYEAAGLGCCQVADRLRPGLAADYREGEEMVSFEALHALPSLLEDLLADEARRRALGEAARRRTLAEHTYRHRLSALLARCHGSAL